MAAISSFYNFDNPFLEQLARIQRQVGHGIPTGMLSMLNSFQQSLQFYSSISMPTYVETLNGLNNMQSSWWQVPRIETIMQSAQRMCDAWTPAMQSIINQQFWAQAVVPRFEKTMFDLIESSYADLPRNFRMSALATTLESFTGLDVFDDDLPVEMPGLTDEESAQLAAEISEAADDRQNWQQRMMAVIQDWKARNPIAAGLVQLIVTTVISQLLWKSLCWGAATLRDSIIREEPTSKAAVVCQVRQGETITVVGDAPYYYLVESPIRIRMNVSPAISAKNR